VKLESAFRWAKFVLPIVVLVLAAIYLWKTFEPAALGDAVAQLDWVQLVWISVPLILLVFAIRTARWWWLLADLGARGTNVLRLYFAISMTVGLAAITPMQSGEAFKIWLARREMKAGLAEVSALHILERLLDVIVLAALTFIALLVSPGSQLSVIGLLGLSVLLALVGLAAFHERIGSFLPSFVHTGMHSIMQALRRPKHLIVLVLITLSGWVVTTGLWAFAFQSAGVGAFAPATLITIVGLVTFATIFSFLPGGIGVSEASAAALLLAAGSSPEIALAGALALRMIGVMTVLLGAVFWGVRQIWPTQSSS